MISAEDITKSNTKAINKQFPSTSVKLRDKLERNDELSFTSFSYSLAQNGWFCEVCTAFAPASRNKQVLMNQPGKNWKE